METSVAFPENWTPPRELTRALPRETQLSGRGKLMAVMGWIFLMASIPVYILMQNQDRERTARVEALRTQGREANGEIVRLWHSSGKSHTPMVSYAFTANGVRLHGESSVPGDSWDGIQKVGFLPIRYLPSNPATNHPAAWEESGPPAWMTFIFPVILVVAGAFMLWNLRRQSQVAAEGVPAAGVVTKCFRVKNGWVVRYQFRVKDGTVGFGRDQVHRKLEAGAAVCVLYLPEKPGRCFLYPMCSYRVVTQ
jgi:hypothetical protein